MEDAVKDQSSVSEIKGGGSAKLLRYPLRSATKFKDDKPLISAPSTASRRGRTSSSVSQSVSVLDISAKEKSAKPPRRLSIPTKSTASPAPKPAFNITPISEARANRSRKIEAKSDTPIADVSRSSSRKKFSVLSSASYWLSQIKLSESAGKHQVSLGFFKLAQVAACENLQLLRNELQSYALRHNILDLGESAKEVLQSYEIPKFVEQVQVSETCSHEPEQGTQSSSDETHSLPSINEIPKLKPSSSNDNADSAKENNQKKKLVSDETHSLPSINEIPKLKPSFFDDNADSAKENNQKKKFVSDETHSLPSINEIPKLKPSSSNDNADSAKENHQKKKLVSDETHSLPSINEIPKLKPSSSDDNADSAKENNQKKKLESDETHSLPSINEIPKLKPSSSNDNADSAKENNQKKKLVSDETHSLPSINEIPKLKPSSSNDNADSAKENNQKKKLVSTTKSSTNKKKANQKSAMQAGGGKMQNDLRKPSKKSNEEKQMVKSKGKKSEPKVEISAVSSSEEAITEGNKENMDAPSAAEISLET